ncbi:uncharacterized protein AC631_05308 [Debaryomyces fabryi]|uniref:Uncharacterized protein n=1 Tax=Debaryomyces fabryi TaxID=58627 RepID=A0A0V1PRS1_9ASCO|nr:uncharacterized protein AC631_05308 [Debaryomyces fabryi]KRZ98933.1 hypothetical protein AC631_05308 [Debaryomyces fabryi]
MSFSYSNFADERTEESVKLFGRKHPFRHHSVVKDYIQKEIAKFEDLVQYNTSVEKVVKRGGKWTISLRVINKNIKGQDYWYEEVYDAIIVANGHYSIPYIPKISGLVEVQQQNSEIIEHTKSFRKVSNYKNKKICIVGTGTSATDLISDTVGQSKGRIIVSSRSEPGELFKSSFGDNKNVLIKPEISKIYISDDKLTASIVFVDGSIADDVERIIFATGYLYNFPFFRNNEVTVNKSNRVEKLYQHIFKVGDPTLSFVGIVVASITFRIFEYQSTLISGILRGRISLPPIQKQLQWEEERIASKGDSRAFHVIPPEYQNYYQDLLDLVGPYHGLGHQLEPYNEEWEGILNNAISLKLKYWTRNIEP